MKTPFTAAQERKTKQKSIYSSPRVSLLSFVLSKLRFSSSSGVSYLSPPNQSLYAWYHAKFHLDRLAHICVPPCWLRGRVWSLLDLAIVVVVLEEADDGADAAGAEAVGRVADCGGVCQLLFCW